MSPKVFIILFSGIAAVLLLVSLRSGTRLFQLPPTAPPWPSPVEKQADLRGLSPLGFLESLKQQKDAGPVIFVAPIEGWVTKEHLASLLALTDSPEPCASVMMVQTSHLDGRSTVGAEALCLLAGIRAGKYPPWLNSDLPQEPAGETLTWARKQAAMK